MQKTIQEFYQEQRTEFSSSLKNYLNYLQSILNWSISFVAESTGISQNILESWRDNTFISEPSFDELETLSTFASYIEAECKSQMDKDKYKAVYLMHKTRNKFNDELSNLTLKLKESCYIMTKKHPDELTDSHFSEALDEFLYCIKIKYKISSVNVAQELGVSKNTISSWRVGAVPNYENTKKLAEYATKILFNSKNYSDENEFERFTDNFIRFCYHRMEQLDSTKYAQDIIVSLLQGKLKSSKDEPAKIEHLPNSIRKATEFGLFDTIIDGDTVFPGASGLSERAVAKKNKATFVKNFSRLLHLLDKVANNRISDYKELGLCKLSEKDYTLKDEHKQKLQELIRNKLNYRSIDDDGKPLSVQRGLAEYLNVDIAQITNWKNGVDLPTFSNLHKLQKLFGFDRENAFLISEISDFLFLTTLLNLVKQDGE
ncbi:TPA: helix-turn-helix transcriptional regulator [Streptococcus equi subsp. zooepidemicus]|nr:helix-turn-helix transcriptional regulator [Streptococcus equi subsp. zooepidemicus]